MLHCRPAVFLCLLSLLIPAASFAQAEDDGPLRSQYEQVVTRAISYLSSKGRADDGSYSAFAGPAVTALVTHALLRHGRSVDDPLVAPSLKYLTGFVQPDGGIYRAGSLYRNYETCLTMLCLAEANGDGRYDRILAGADTFVKELQWTDVDRSELAFGGGGYGKHKRPDMSNTGFLIEALLSAGNDADSEAIQSALVFVTRCQNHESPANTSPFATRNPDGGFYYTVAAGGTSQAGETANGGLRSYGSMTYLGLKSLIYAGVERDDPRVQAAFAWIQKHYALDRNPGMGTAGLFYYYHTFAKTLHAMQVETLVDDEGIKHDWRADLIRTLARRQRSDGSWVNENDRWMEGDPNLVTAYALLALSYCDK